MTPRIIRISTLTSAGGGAGDGPCEDRETCEGVHEVVDRPDLYYVVVTEVTDAAEVAAFRRYVGPSERLGTVRRQIIDRLPR